MYLYDSEFAQIYEKLDVTVIERGESFYQDLMKAMVEELDAKGMPTFFRLLAFIVFFHTTDIS